MARNNKSLVSISLGSFLIALALAGLTGCAMDSAPTEEDKQDDQISESVNNIVQGDVGNPSRDEGSGSNTPGSAERDPTPIAAQSRPYAPQPQPWVQQLTGSGDAPQPQPWAPSPASTSPKH